MEVTRTVFAQDIFVERFRVGNALKDPNESDTRRNIAFYQFTVFLLGLLRFSP